jgi:O-antigen/teichoic acid export membrane protein
LGVLLIVLFLALYAVFVATIAAPILKLHALLQLPVWLLLGVVWIFPMMPLVRWIETGRLRK